MKWAILISNYSIKTIEADDAPGAARAFLEANPDGARRTTAKKALSRRVTGPKSVRVVDVEAGMIREFHLSPPPPPPMDQWIVAEITEDEDDDDEDDDDPNDI